MLPSPCLYIFPLFGLKEKENVNHFRPFLTTFNHFSPSFFLSYHIPAILYILYFYHFDITFNSFFPFNHSKAASLALCGSNIEYPDPPRISSARRLGYPSIFQFCVFSLTYNSLLNMTIHDRQKIIFFRVLENELSILIPDLSIIG